jgi:penicillin-binding protein 1A
MMRIVRIFSISLYPIVYSIVPIFLGIVCWLMHHQVINFSVLSHYSVGKPSIVLDENGIEWARFELDRCDPIAIKDMPKNLINAFIAAEDWNFLQHHGISWKGICRSLLVNLYYRRVVQGASTITQQLVKLLFLDLEKTIYRKLKEQIYSFLVEQHFSKDQILQAYLNYVYFGCGIYGVQAAAKRFWNKNVDQLTISECATLAGIVQSPCYYCPITNPQAACTRRNVVLGKMKRLCFVSRDEYEDAHASSCEVVHLGKFFSNAAHAREHIRQMLEPVVGRKNLYSGGLTIKTTINSILQKKAENIFKQHIKELKEGVTQIDGGLITVEVKTGAIRAVVGGYDFSSSQFNRVFQAKRQIGSTFKPILYAAVIASGRKFFETEIDEPFILSQHGKTWAPHNYNHIFVGEISLAYALQRSNNIVAIKTFLGVGAGPIMKLARECGLTGDIYPYPALALGCVDASLQEVVGMFNVFANDGVYVKPHIISWVKDQWGKKIMRSEVCSHRVMSSWVSGQVCKVLESCMSRYQRLFSKVNPHTTLPCHAIGKTGTTNDSRTCWFTGSTPELTTAVYIGCDDNKSMGKNVYPLKTAFPIWMGLCESIACSQTHFKYDPSLIPAIIEEKSGKISLSKDKDGVLEIFV